MTVAAPKFWGGSHCLKSLGLLATPQVVQLGLVVEGVTKNDETQKEPEGPGAGLEPAAEGLGRESVRAVLGSWS